MISLVLQLSLGFAILTSQLPTIIFASEEGDLPQVFPSTLVFTETNTFSSLTQNKTARVITTSSNYAISGNCPDCEHSVAASVEIHSKEFVDLVQRSNYSYTHTSFDNGGVPMIGTEIVFLMAPKSISLNGALNSAITTAMAHHLSFIGFPLVTISSTSELSNKMTYPTVTRTAPNDESWSKIIVGFMKKMGWSRIGGIYTDDSFGIHQFRGFRRAAPLFGVSLVHEVDISVDVDTRLEIRAKLQSLKDLKLKVFFISAVTTPLHIIFEEAHKMNMFGEKGHLWVTTQGIAFNNFFRTWEYGLAHPEITPGIISINVGCDESSQEYKYFNNYMQSLNIDYRIDMFMCLSYDAQKAVYNSLVKVASFMLDHNIDLKCLEQQFFIDNSALCQNRTDILEVKAIVLKRAHCQTYHIDQQCRHCGVCQLFSQYETDWFQGDVMQYYQVLMLSELYESNFTGSSGRVSFDNVGDRNLEGVYFSILNSQFINDQNVTVMESVGEVQMHDSNNITTDTLEVILDHPIVYAESTWEEPNYLRPVDTLPYVVHETALAYRIAVVVVITLLICGALGITYAYYYFRKSLILKTSAPIMMYFLMSGSIILLCSIYPLFLPASLTSNMCIVHEFFFTIGFALCFGPILIKTWRLKVIFTDTKNVVLKLQDSFLVKILCGFVSFFLAYLIVWFAVEAPTVNIVIIPSTDNLVGDELQRLCSKTYFNYIITIVEFLTVFVAAILAYYVHKIPNLYYNEAREICITVYNYILIFFIHSLLVYFVALDPTAIITIEGISIMVQGVVFILAFFGYKILKVLQTNSIDDDSAMKGTPNGQHQTGNVIHCRNCGTAISTIDNPMHHHSYPNGNPSARVSMTDEMNAEVILEKLRQEQVPSTSQSRSNANFHPRHDYITDDEFSTSDREDDNYR